MSHVVLQESENPAEQYRDIAALKRAVERCGGVFKEGQTRWHSYATDAGRLVGDYPVPAGYTEREIVEGKCLHAIGLSPEAARKQGGTGKYEIGVVASKKHPGTFALLCDFWGGGLDRAFSTGNKGDLQKLQSNYQLEAARGVGLRDGWVLHEKAEADGSVTLTAEKPRTF